MPAAAPSAAALTRAAKVVAETGVVICIEARDGTLYRLTPPGAPSPIGATEREADECDRAFGVGSSG
jgi:hypothetical protein